MPPTDAHSPVQILINAQAHSPVFKSPGRTLQPARPSAQPRWGEPGYSVQTYEPFDHDTGKIYSLRDFDPNAPHAAPVTERDYDWRELSCFKNRSYHVIKGPQADAQWQEVQQATTAKWAEGDRKG